MQRGMLQLVSQRSGRDACGSALSYVERTNGVLVRRSVLAAGSMGSPHAHDAAAISAASGRLTASTSLTFACCKCCKAAHSSSSTSSSSLILLFFFFLIAGIIGARLVVRLLP